jgi:hypothetical protein
MYQEALQELGRASAQLRRLVDAGRADLEPLLVLACMNSGVASRNLGQAEAQQHAETSVAIYERLVATGRLDLPALARAGLDLSVISRLQRWPAQG